MHFPDDDLPDDVLCAIADHVEARLMVTAIVVLVCVYTTGRIEYRWATCNAYTAHLMDIVDNNPDEDAMFGVLLDPVWTLAWNVRKAFDLQSCHRIIRLSTVFMKMQSSESDL